MQLSGKGHPHQHRAVLSRKRPAHSNNEGQEERNTTTLQAPDRRAVRWHHNVEEEQESKVIEDTQEVYQEKERSQAHTGKQMNKLHQMRSNRSGPGTVSHVQLLLMHSEHLEQDH